MLTQRVDVVCQVVSHITTTVQENSGALVNQFTGISSILDLMLTQALQASVLP